MPQPPAPQKEQKSNEIVEEKIAEQKPDEPEPKNNNNKNPNNKKIDVQQQPQEANLLSDLGKRENLNVESNQGTQAQLNQQKQD